MPLPRDVRPQIMRYRAHLIRTDRRFASRTISRNFQVALANRASDRLERITLDMNHAALLEEICSGDFDRRTRPIRLGRLMAALPARYRSPQFRRYSPRQDLATILRINYRFRIPSASPRGEIHYYLPSGHGPEP